MAKVFGIHPMEPLPGVKAEDFERFVIEEVLPVLAEGAETYLLKGDKGERVGKYVFLFAFDSVEARNQIWGPPGGPAREWSEADRELWAKYGTLATVSSWADYVVVGEQVSSP